MHEDGVISELRRAEVVGGRHGLGLIEVRRDRREELVLLESERCAGEG